MSKLRRHLTVYLCKWHVHVHPHTYLSLIQRKREASYNLHLCKILLPFIHRRKTYLKHPLPEGDGRSKEDVSWEGHSQQALRKQLQNYSVRETAYRPRPSHHHCTKTKQHVRAGTRVLDVNGMRVLVILCIHVRKFEFWDVCPTRQLITKSEDHIKQKVAIGSHGNSNPWQPSSISCQSAVCQHVSQSLVSSTFKAVTCLGFSVSNNKLPLWFWNQHYPDDCLKM